LEYFNDICQRLDDLSGYKGKIIFILKSFLKCTNNKKLTLKIFKLIKEIKRKGLIFNLNEEACFDIETDISKIHIFDE